MTTETTIRGTEADMRSVVDRFGGGDLIASVLGMFTALGVLVLLGALIAAGDASISYQLNAIDVDGNLTEVEVVGALVALAVLFVAFFVGGVAAGRSARYDGGINGAGAALLFVLLVAIFGALGKFVGADYNAFAVAGLPDWFSQFGADDVTLKAIAAGAAGIVASLLGGYVGGMLGEQFHHKADAALVQESANGSRAGEFVNSR